MLFSRCVILATALAFSACQPANSPAPTPHLLTFETARQNAEAAREAFDRSNRYMHGWGRHVDEQTGLIPRNLTQHASIWTPHDSGADNFPFLILTASLTEPDALSEWLLPIFDAERELTNRIDRLPDTFDFKKSAFRDPKADLDRITYSASEYAKDGLLPISEWLGPGPWFDRLIELVDDTWKHAAYETPAGPIISQNHEINGEMLQILSRLYWATQDERYLDWAIRLGDFYLLGNQHPTADADVLQLRDHGCEVISGLSELYATVSFARPAKKDTYQAPLHEMLDRVLEVGRNEHGLFHNRINPQTGEVLHEGAADTWGYTFNAYYTVYLIDGVEAYREATLKAFDALIPHYSSYDWENGSADGYADTIESALNLYNREPTEDAAVWMDAEIRIMWDKQQEDGVIEGWHGDGNFARTSLMYALWKTQGVTVDAWASTLSFGAQMHEDVLHVVLSSKEAWEGRLQFDQPRHHTHFNLPLDWPRINQFPEWFTVDAENWYGIHDVGNGQTMILQGYVLQEGYLVALEPGSEKQFLVWPLPT